MTVTMVKRGASLLKVILIITVMHFVEHIVHRSHAISGESNKSNESVKLVLGTEVGNSALCTPLTKSICPLWDDFRLPSDVVPSAYYLLIDPNLQAGTFTGRVRIKVDLKSSRNKIIVHCHEKLNITKKVIQKSNEDVKIIKSCRLLSKELCILETEDEMKPGRYQIHFEFRGLMDEAFRLYRSQYFDIETAETKYLAATNFQPTYARRVFPCFDEPTFKSNFTISLVHSKDLVSFSNMPKMGEEVTPSGKWKITFQESMSMMTYLVFFAIGNIQHTSKKNETVKQMRVFAAPPVLELANIDDISTLVLNACEKYFAIEYPLKKLDIVAIPDYAKGSMAHWGIFTFKESTLTIPTTLSKLQYLFIRLIRNLANMWFGNLVMMKWWDELWLSEGFTSFLSYKIYDGIEPTWNLYDYFLTEEFQPAMKTDAISSSQPIVRPINHPEEIHEIFNGIAFRKSASIIRMLEFILQPEDFRAGITRFLNKYKYGDAEAEDLWEIMSSIMEESFKSNYFCRQCKENRNVSLIMSTWTKQSGFPMVKVRQFSECTVTLQQHIFSTVPHGNDEDRRVWSIPVSYRTPTNENGLKWLHDTNIKEIYSPKHYSWIKFNTNQAGYFIVNYDRELWYKIIHTLRLHPEVFSPADRSNLIFDAFQLAWYGHLEYEVAFDLTKYLLNEAHLTPWKTAYEALREVLNTLKYNITYNPLKLYLKKLIIPIYNKIDWDANLDKGENLLRDVVLKFACELEISDCLDKTSRLLKKWFDNLFISIELQELVYFYGMQQIENDEYWFEMWKRYLKETTAHTRDFLLLGLAQVRYPHLMYRYLDYAMNESYVKREDYFTVLHHMSKNDVGRPIVWDFIRNNWSYLVDRFSLRSNSLGKIIDICEGFHMEFRLNEMKEFFQKYPDAGAGKHQRQRALEVVEHKINWIKLHSEKIGKWLAAV